MPSRRKGICLRRTRNRRKERSLSMPKGYEKIRDSFIKEGMSKKAAQEKAAKIWNSKHKGAQSVGKGRK